MPFERSRVEEPERTRLHRHLGDSSDTLIGVDRVAAGAWGFFDRVSFVETVTSTTFASWTGRAGLRPKGARTVKIGLR